MFKRKLAKKGLFGNGLLFLVAVVSMAATSHISDVASHQGNDTLSNQLSFDTFLLKLNGTPAAGVDVPAIAMNKKAESFVHKYIEENSEILGSIRARSDRYFKITDEVFNRYGLPVELKYLAVVESELNTKAVSHVGARGAWQLMPETARLLSLKITKKYDERTHFYKSTVAAARYMKDLYQIYNDWLLVIASYNCGPGRINDAIRKAGSRNFWKMQYFLPAETRGHVKRFVAIHYYFEGKGSVTTLTKEEARSYRKKMEEFIITQTIPAPSSATPGNAVAAKGATGAEIVAKAEIKTETRPAN